jgi:hypothetical protein
LHKTHDKKGGNVTRHRKLFKGTVAGLIGLLIVLVAMDHRMRTRVPVYSIDANGPLEWTAPDQLVDGSPLPDLTGYTIYCWNAANQQTLEIEIDDPESASFEMTNFEPGTYQCAINAVSETSGESVLSSVVTRTIP